MRRKLIFGGLAVLGLGACALGGVAYVASDFGTLLWLFGEPSGHFGDLPPPPVPDYASLDAWAAHPGKIDRTDRRADDDLPMLTPDPDRGADVFFVHPTTYLVGDNWNAAIDDRWAASFIDDFVMPYQAAAYSECCRIWAPRYRQGIFHAFMVKSDDSEAAFDLAYSDVDRAFDVFLEGIGDGPFVLASHSQGSMHAMRLLQQRIAGTPLEDRLVAAYLIGYAIPEHVGPIGPCEGPEDTDCVIGWNSMDERGKAWHDAILWDGGWTRSSKTPICTNPLTFEHDGVADASANLGGLVDAADGLPVLPTPGLTSARCDAGRMVIEPPTVGSWRLLFGDEHQDWHNYDYALFFANIRANAKLRTDAWHARPDPVEDGDTAEP